MSAQLRLDPGTTQLRAMQDADLPQVLAIESAAYAFPWSIGVFRDCLRAGYGCWVLEAESMGILGYAVLSVAAEEAHLLNVCVGPELQGQGHGRRLVQRMLDVARYHGAQRLFLEVRPSNPGALMLYQSLGFAEIGRRPRYYPAEGGREDAIVMGRELVGSTVRP
jgi:ribosomal-protein-alanine N-acetyltransferase